MTANIVLTFKKGKPDQEVYTIGPFLNIDTIDEIKVLAACQTGLNTGFLQKFQNKHPEVTGSDVGCVIELTA